MKKLFFMMLLTVFMVSCGGNSNPNTLYPNTSYTNDGEDEVRVETKGSFSTKEDIQANLDGSIWTYTEPLQNIHSSKMLECQWWRIEFKNGKAYIQDEFPSNGYWGEVKEEPYEIAEGRYADTGEKYVVVKFSFYRFIPETGQFSIPIESSSIKLKQKDFNWD